MILCQTCWRHLHIHTSIPETRPSPKQTTHNLVWGIRRFFNHMTAAMIYKSHRWLLQNLLLWWDGGPPLSSLALQLQVNLMYPWFIYFQNMSLSLSTFGLVESNTHIASYHCATCSTWNILCTNLLLPQMYSKNAKHTCWCDSCFYCPCCSWNPMYSKEHLQTIYMPHQLHLLIHHCNHALCIFSLIINHIHSPSNWMVTSIPWILLDTTNKAYLIINSWIQWI
jgi:hypothetical protein